MRSMGAAVLPLPRSRMRPAICLTRLPISLYPGMRVAQLVFEMLSTPADRPYGHGGLGSKYQGQRGPTPSRSYLNFVKDS